MSVYFNEACLFFFYTTISLYYFSPKWLTLGTPFTGLG